MIAKWVTSYNINLTWVKLNFSTSKKRNVWIHKKKLLAYDWWKSAIYYRAIVQCISEIFVPWRPSCCLWMHRSMPRPCQPNENIKNIFPFLHSPLWSKCPTNTSCKCKLATNLTLMLLHNYASRTKKSNFPMLLNKWGNYWHQITN